MRVRFFTRIGLAFDPVATEAAAIESMAMLQRVIQCARSYLPESFFASAPQLLWTGAAASASTPSNPLSEALWIAAPKSKVRRREVERSRSLDE